jgi:hypothetical protein
MKSTEEIINSFYKMFESVFQDPRNEHFSQRKFDEMCDFLRFVLTQRRKEFEEMIEGLQERIDKEKKLKINRQTSVPSIVKTMYGADWVSHYYERTQGFISGLMVAKDDLKLKLESQGKEK